jgi:hypothetical protein
MLIFNAKKAGKFWHTPLGFTNIFISYYTANFWWLMALLIGKTCAYFKRDTFGGFYFNCAQ